MNRVKTKTSTIPERFVWAAGLLQHKPDEHILEIGCGVGLLAAEVAGTLTSGRFYGVDPSPFRLAQARKRNQSLVDSGIVFFQETSFLAADLPLSFFHRIVAFNVNIFFQDPVKELNKATKLLHPTGSLFIFYQAPFEIDLGAAAPLLKNLQKNSFKILGVQLKQLQPTSALCVEAKPL